MNEFKYPIPTDKLPEHVHHDCLIRGIKNIPPEASDFRPTFVSDKIKFNRFLNGMVFEDIGEYGMSVFNSIANLNTFFKTKVSPSFDRKHIGVAKGHSNEALGITDEADKDGHINYFLFNYEDDEIMKDFNEYEPR